MKRINSLLVVAVMLVTVALTMLYAHSRSQDSNRQVSQEPRPDSAAVQRIGLEKTITTQQRLNHYFHGDVVPKLKDCWSRVQGKGTIALKYTYTKGSEKWMFDKLEVSQSTLPRGQDAVALRCMQDAVRGTSYPVEQGEGNQNKFVLNWSWPVPFPANANELTSAMFAARGAGGSGGGTGGCDGHGATAKCYNCSGGSCITVCVGYSTCSLTYYKQQNPSCSASDSCASGGPFGAASSYIMY
jgi:hypothetical protein